MTAMQTYGLIRFVIYFKLAAKLAANSQKYIIT